MRAHREGGESWSKCVKPTLKNSTRCDFGKCATVVGIGCPDALEYLHALRYLFGSGPRSSRQQYHLDLDNSSSQAMNICQHAVKIFKIRYQRKADVDGKAKRGTGMIPTSSAQDDIQQPIL